MRSSSVSSLSRSSGSSQLNGASSLTGAAESRAGFSAACVMAGLFTRRTSLGRLGGDDHPAADVVGGDGVVEPLDLRLGAVPFGDHLLPLRGVKLLRRLAGFPDVDAAALAVAEHVVLGDQAGQVAILRRGRLERLGGFFEARSGAQAETDGGDDHGGSPLVCGLRSWPHGIKTRGNAPSGVATTNVMRRCRSGAVNAGENERPGRCDFG